MATVNFYPVVSDYVSARNTKRHPISAHKHAPTQVPLLKDPEDSKRRHLRQRSNISVSFYVNLGGERPTICQRIGLFQDMQVAE